MTLQKLKEVVDKLVVNAGDCAPHVNVEVWFKKSVYSIREIRQFSVVPTVTIMIGKKADCIIESSESRQ